MTPFKIICPQRMDFFAKSPYSLIRTLLILMGAWPPYQDKFLSHLHKAVILFCFVLSFVGKVPTIIRKNNSIDLMIKNGAGLAAMLSTILKYISIWIKISYMGQLMGWIEHNSEYYTLAKEQDLLYEYACKSHLFTYGYILFYQLASIVVTVLHLTPRVLDIVAPANYSRPQIVLFEVEFFLDSTEHCYVVFFQTIIGMHMGACAQSLFDAVYVTFMLHLCAVCKIVGSRFKHLFSETKIHNCTNGKKCSFHWKLKECIEDHKTLISVIDSFNECCSTGFTIGLLVVIICLPIALLQLYKALLLNHDVEQIFLYSIFIFTVMWNTLIFVWPGQLLLDASSDMYYGIYAGRWYTACVRVQKMMILIVRMSSEPLALYLGNNYIRLSFENFAKVMNIPVSYFMVLCSVYKEKYV